jgi:hypothetical protein
MEDSAIGVFVSGAANPGFHFASSGAVAATQSGLGHCNKEKIVILLLPVRSDSDIARAESDSAKCRQDLNSY